MAFEITHNIQIENLLSNIKNKPCCRQRVGAWKSLSLGFGTKIFHEKNLIDPYYGEWEIGTYSSAWRIIKDDDIAIGSRQASDSVVELNDMLQSIRFGHILNIQNMSKFDIRVLFDNNLMIEFLKMSNDRDDEAIFHVFGPENLYIEYKNRTWVIGKSDRAWEHKA